MYPHFVIFSFCDPGIPSANPLFTFFLGPEGLMSSLALLTVFNAEFIAFSLTDGVFYVCTFQRVFP